MQYNDILRGALEKTNWRIAVPLILLTVSVLAGQFSLSRLIPWLPEDLVRVRMLALVMAVVGLWPEIRKNWRTAASPSFFAFLALCTYLVVRGLFEPGPRVVGKTVDIIVMLSQAGLFILVASNAAARRVIALTIMACAFVLLLIEAKGQLSFLTGESASFGFGWGALIGSITFNRIQFLAFCVTLCVLSTQRASSRTPFVGLAITTILFLFATWGSLQKGALVATLVVLTGLFVAYIVQSQWKMVAILGVVIGFAALLTSLIFGTHLSGRFQQATRLSSVSEKPERKVRLAELVDRSRRTDVVADSAGTNFYSKPTPNQSSKASVTIRYCYFKSATLRKRHPGTPVLCYERTLTDLTSRLPLAIEAMRGFLARPVFGNGLASYRVEFIHPEVPIPDIYLYPHNLLLEVAFESGTIGLTLLIFALAISFYLVWRVDVPPAFLIPVLGFAGFMTISVLVSGDFYDSRLLWLALFLLSSWGRTAEQRTDDI